MRSPSGSECHWSRYDTRIHNHFTNIPIYYTIYRIYRIVFHILAFRWSFSFHRYVVAVVGGGCGCPLVYHICPRRVRPWYRPLAKASASDVHAQNRCVVAIRIPNCRTVTKATTHNPRVVRRMIRRDFGGGGNNNAARKSRGKQSMTFRWQLSGWVVTGHISARGRYS